MLDSAAGLSLSDNLRGKIVDRDFLIAPEVKDFPNCLRGLDQAGECIDNILNVTEASGLLAIAIDLQRLVGKGGLNESRKHHPIHSNLRGPTVLNSRTMTVGRPYWRWYANARNSSIPLLYA